ncbi:hypothetical protein FHW23_000101 [Curtobacterium pusillum]|uniref:Uncharacterized protein n=1 Tax=Curtobacterium pusillum TaxID=69373 RepID=A0AAW3T116_9MICO|nr:hypothetical protein [Curtobacterium pusillum]MBA8988869.1 hypothetical protein [Curtobacterium pusillum]
MSNPEDSNYDKPDTDDVADGKDVDPIDGTDENDRPVDNPSG